MALFSKKKHSRNETVENRRGRSLETYSTEPGPLPAIGKEELLAIQEGVMRYTYKGVGMQKCPFDLSIYSKLLFEQKPGSILEFGSRFGGSALWFADQMRLLDLPGRVVSVDLVVPKGVEDERVTFLHGDANEPGEVLTEELLASMPKPWFVIEDSSHRYGTTLAVLDFLHEHLTAGDRIIVEDAILESFGWAEEYGGGPRPAVHDFVERHGGLYQIDREHCDFFGPNVTWNPDGYLVRVE